MALGSALGESAERYNRELHYNGKVVAMDRVNDGKIVELTDGEYTVLSSQYFPNKDELGTKLLYPAYRDNGTIIYNIPITQNFTNKDLNLNNPRDFETLRRKTDMSYENINANTNIVFINGMGNTLEDARNSANLIQRGFLNKQVGIVNNATRGFVNDVLEYNPNTLSVTDFIIANQIQKLSPNTFYTAHSRGNRDINNANFINATTNTETNYKLISVGSPIAESELRESTNAVGAELVRQVNDSRDPVANPTGAALDIVGNAIVGGSRGGYIGFSLGALSGIGITLYKLDEYHPFKSYYNNPEFQLQQTIQRLLMQDAMKEVKEKGLDNDKD